MKPFFLIAIFLLATATIHAQDIFNAVIKKDPGKVNKFIEHDASLLNSRDEAGNTPLHHAAMIGSAEITELLLSNGADINAQNAQLNTPLHEAIQNQQEKISAILIDNGADLNRTNIHNQTPLHRAASLNQKKTGEMLIAKGAAIDPVDQFGRTPFLTVARQTGDVQFGKLLMNHGANIHVKDQNNQMALNLAAWKGFNDFINFLLDNRAEYYSSQRESRWMLEFAASCASSRLFKVVMGREKALLSDESFSKRIMQMAIRGGSVDIVNLLMAKNIPLNYDANRYGWTPAHYAARHGHADMIRFLAERKFDVNRRTLSGKSVYNIAEENDQSEVLDTIKGLKGDTNPRRFPELTGKYIGQARPAGNSELFAPDIVSGADGDDNHGSITLTPDGKEIYWNMRWKETWKIWVTKIQNNKWTEPQLASFSEVGLTKDDNPFISPDGEKLFFTSTRSGSVSEKKENIWFVERTSSAWSEAKPVSAEVNAMQLHWGISVSNSGALYFGGSRQDSYGKTDIYYSKLVNGAYVRPVNMGAQINSTDTDHCPYIAPDESYIIFSRFGRQRGFYISFKDQLGRWLNPVKIHESLEGVCPFISPDRKYFFFNCDGIYWMSAQFIEEFKPKE